MPPKVHLEARNVICRAQGRGAAASKKKKPEVAPDVQAAIDAVDRAVKLLPEEEKVNFTVFEQQEGGGWNQRANDAPAQNPGSKVASCSHFCTAKGREFEMLIACIHESTLLAFHSTHDEELHSGCRPYQKAIQTA